jgi:hypothetical protein
MRAALIIGLVATPAFGDGTTGVCNADAKVANVGDERQPAKVASCPSPMDYVRGNGFGKGPYPDVKPSALPPWDLAGALQFACAYACVANGAHAAMIGWSIYQDDRPLRNDNAAYVISDGNAWTVVVMWRHAFNPWWNIGGGVHDAAVPIRKLDHAPTAAELDQMLRGNSWDFSADQSGFTLIGANTIDANWPSAPPTHFPKAPAARP